MRFIVFSAVVSFILLVACLGLLEIGRKVGKEHLATSGTTAGFANVETAVFGLLGLLLAFTFSGGITRFDERRQLIVEEANTISSAYLQMDLLPEMVRAPLQKKMRAYVSARLEVSQLPGQIAGGKEFLSSEPVSRSAAIFNEIWQDVARTSYSRPSESVERILMPSLTAMDRIARTRNSVGERHPPKVIYAMLFALTLVSSLLAGYGMAANRKRSWVHMLGFATTVFVICDIEFPRQGLIRVDMFDHVLAQALSNFP
jgi:hypothetical protein